MSAGSTDLTSASPARVSERIPSEQRRTPRKLEPRTSGSLRTYVASEPDDDARERDHLLGRLENLRTIVPVFAHEFASARRQTAALRLENSRLLERIRELQRKRTRPT